MSCRTAMWCSSALTYKLYALLIAAVLLGGCQKAPSVSSVPEPYALSKPVGAMAAELVDTARLQSVFKLTYEEMSDIYGIDLSVFERLVCYLPAPSNDAGLLLFGSAYSLETVDAARLELRRQLFLLQDAYPDSARLKEAVLVGYGRYLLLVASEDNSAAVSMLERALGVNDAS